MTTHSNFLLFFEIEGGVLCFIDNLKKPEDVKTECVYIDKFNCSVRDLGVGNFNVLFKTCFFSVDKTKLFLNKNLQKYFPN